VIALGTALSLKNRMSSKPAMTELTQVIVAATDIPAGNFVRSDAQLVFADWPKANITESMLTNQNAKTQDFNGAVARRAIQKGEPILKNLLVKSNEGGFMSAVLEPGKRAVSLAVDSTTGNAGFIFPGDKVDLILTHSVSRQAVKSRASETFIEDVRVLAVDQMIDNPDNKAVLAKTVTLEVTPKQAEEINLAKDLGKISLSLRSLASNKAIPTPEDARAVGFGEPETLDDILRAGGAEPLPPSNLTRDTEVSKIISPEDAAGKEVIVIRGNERTAVQFGPTEPEEGQ
jgi:pilus assembly protein CpaB